MKNIVKYLNNTITTENGEIYKDVDAYNSDDAEAICYICEYDIAQMRDLLEDGEDRTDDELKADGLAVSRRRIELAVVEYVSDVMPTIERWEIDYEHGSGSGCDKLFDTREDAEFHMKMWTEEERRECSVECVTLDTKDYLLCHPDGEKLLKEAAADVFGELTWESVYAYLEGSSIIENYFC